MESIILAAQPYITAIVSALLGLLATILLTILARLQSKVIAWLETRTNADQRELLHKLAAEAYAYVESQFSNAAGQEKMNAAIQYVLPRLHLTRFISSEDIMAAIQKAWAELDTKNRQSTL
ncbi:MAG: hypothetical protein K0R57_2099 [Paenibacillaceae bacterium]|nr:hypothetical protein [Paenibacillaceae bacterium]